jgi:sugar/nucleoside kinase (ribokinase family)
LLQPANLSQLANHITRIHAIFPHITQIQNLFRNDTLQLWQQMAMLASFGPKIVVVRNEPHPYWLYDKESGLRWEVPWYPIENPNLLGCGNAFGGGFSAGYALTSDPVHATLYGAISASFAAQSSSPFNLFETYLPLAQARLHKLTQFVQPV